MLTYCHSSYCANAPTQRQIVTLHTHSQRATETTYCQGIILKIKSKVFTFERAVYLLDIVDVPMLPVPQNVWRLSKFTESVAYLTHRLFGLYFTISILDTNMMRCYCNKSVHFHCKIYGTFQLEEL